MKEQTHEIHESRMGAEENDNDYEKAWGRVTAKGAKGREDSERRACADGCGEPSLPVGGVDLRSTRPAFGSTYWIRPNISG